MISCHRRLHPGLCGSLCGEDNPFSDPDAYNDVRLMSQEMKCLLICEPNTSVTVQVAPGYELLSHLLPNTVHLNLQL